MKTIKGVFTALITPFNNKGELDQEGFRANIRFQIENGVHGIVPLGTTGEAPTLSHQEQETVLRIAVQEAKGKIPIMAGTGSYSTQQTILNTQQAEKLGADAVLVVSPYYNKPTPEGLYRHFKAICDNTSLPIIVYNVQGRTAQNISTDTLKRLADLPNVIGVKETSGNLTQVSEVIEHIGRTHPNFSVMSGDDANLLTFMALGGDGVISVLSNLLPAETVQFYQALVDGNYAEARELHYRLIPLIRTLFIETNPIPIKAAMQYRGMAAGGYRLPLCELMPQNQAALQAAVESYCNAEILSR
ncbi:MAG: 4-hydroxy-tetrahydrodipicolinate synthase [Parachlamydiaceae bacterium]|nr:4-hydroxy-tetrahydrodipicolinate synthase [Parachlamydiaceae bacterium]